MSDVEALRKLLVDELLNLDCVSFLDYLEIQKATQFSEMSDWIFMPEASVLFEVF